MIRRERVDRKHLYTVKCRTALKPETVQEIATSILVAGKKTQIPVRGDGVRSPSSEGHRRGNVPGAGQETIVEYLVPAKHPGARLRPNATYLGRSPGRATSKKKLSNDPFKLKRCDINPLYYIAEFVATEFLP
jgi:hypothetical protein